MESMLVGALKPIAAGLAGGFAVGTLHFLGLRSTARLFAVGRPRLALALQLSRLALVAVVLIALAQRGAPALIAALAGLLAARSLVLARIAPPESDNASAPAKTPRAPGDEQP